MSAAVWLRSRAFRVGRATPLRPNTPLLIRRLGPDTSRLDLVPLQTPVLFPSPRLALWQRFHPRQTPTRPLRFALVVRWATKAEAAVHVRISELIAEAIRDGDLPAYRVGKGARDYHLDHEEVDAWLKARAWEPQCSLPCTHWRRPPGCCKCLNYLRSKLRDGTFAWVKIAGRWRMTEEQILAAIETCGTAVRPPAPIPPSGLSRRSRAFRRQGRGE